MISKINTIEIAKMKILTGVILSVCLIAILGCSQKKLTKSQNGQDTSEVIQEKVYVKVDQMPEFPGGEIGLRNYLNSSVKYPMEAQKNRIQGKVFVAFVIGNDGFVKNVKIVRGVDSFLDEESVRVVKSMPRWIPGREKGKAVAVAFTIPIGFMLQ